MSDEFLEGMQETSFEHIPTAHKILMVYRKQTSWSFSGRIQCCGRNNREIWWLSNFFVQILMRIFLISFPCRYESFFYSEITNCFQPFGKDYLFHWYADSKCTQSVLIVGAWTEINVKLVPPPPFSTNILLIENYC